MYLSFRNLIIVSLILISFTSCSNKKSVEEPIDNTAVVLPPLMNENKIMVGRKLIAANTHLFIRNQQLPPYRTDTTPQRILLIGDSMSKWLRYRLQDYCELNGHTLKTVTWVSGNTEWFAQYDTLNYFIEKDSISYVFLVLGANELFIRDFAKHREKYVDKIIDKLSGVNWIWVGPPNWKKDKGINECLLKKMSEKKFFVSKDLKFKRQRDGMHPTVASCSMWVDSIVHWISITSTSRIKLNVPDSSFNLKPDAVLLRPLDQ